MAQSERYKEYQEACRFFIPAWAKVNIDYPVNIKALYYRKTLRRVDIINLHSALHDVLVYHRVIADDSAISPKIVVSTDGSRVFLDRENPRNIVEITRI